MKKMKSLAAFALALSMAFSLVACGSKEQPKPAASAGSAPAASSAAAPADEGWKF